MFGIFKRRKEFSVDYSNIITDIHSHLLPGIDDGSPDVDTSMKLIKGLQNLGFSNFVTTPHVYQEIHPNTNESIDDAFQILKQTTDTAGFNVNINAAAEYFLDDHFNQLLENEVPLKTLHDNWVLVEWSFVQPPFDLRQTLFNIQIKGYQPIIAHPERYTYYYKDWDALDQLMKAGGFLQMNLLSLAGYYGKAEKNIAEYLISKNKYKLVGTDLHHDRHLRALQSAGHIMHILHEMIDSGHILNPSLVK
ncbi:tyrosine-protein phosphatase [Gynurincola endophyticus]|uniref:tyrosine-protein phosphatase n=1 Tax=Gynurincola endophyticus TaxID=2479004 RepID=UPI000F8EB00A|nr:CpsB/CapC family capsule biosynthesis tyrosine phosphatase [Gynurincola endophyticus]